MPRDLIPGAVVEMGKIKIGTLDPSKPFPGVKLDHFLITTIDRDEKGVLIPDTDLMKSLDKYRDSPTKEHPKGRLRTIPIMFLSNSIEDVLQIRYEWWPGKSRIGASTCPLLNGDAERDRQDLTLTYYCDPKTGEPLAEPRTVDWSDDLLDLPDPKQKDKPLLTLSTTLAVTIASPGARFGGVYRFRTKGWHSTNQLLGSLRWIKRLTCGVLRGPVLKMKVQPKTVRPNGTVGTAQVVHVEPSLDDLIALREEARSHVLYERENILMIREAEQQYKALPPAAEDDTDEETITAPEPKVSAAEAQALIVAQIEKDIAAAATVEALAQLWGHVTDTKKIGDITEEQYQGLSKRKDERKAQLAPPAKTKSKAAEKPEAVLAEIERLNKEFGGTWDTLRAEFGEQFQFTAPKDLTPDNAIKLRDQIRQHVAAKKQADAANAA